MREGFLRYYKGLKEVGLRNWVPHTLQKIRAASEIVRQRDVQRSSETEKIRRLVEVANHRASRAYVPKTYEGKITYFLASSDNDGGGVDPRLEWESYATQGIEMFRIPASSGAQMFAQPYVQELSHQLKAIL